LSESKLSGHCYCGAIKFEIDGDPYWVGHCHCESCRRASGSAMTTFAGFKLEQVTFSGAERSRRTTDDGVTRSFCADCGSPIGYESNIRPDEIHLHLGLFDDLDRLKPQDHSFLEEKASWLKADEHLPQSGWSGEQPD